MEIDTLTANTIINSLQSGVVPYTGLQYIIIGRKQEKDEILRVVERTKQGDSIIKFWVGNFGSGKSFILKLIRQISNNQNYVSMQADFSPERRLYATDGKAIALYQELISNIQSKDTEITGSLNDLLILIATKFYNNFSSTESIINHITNEFRLNGTLSFDMKKVILFWFTSHYEKNYELNTNSLKWLEASYTNKSSSKNEIGISDIISDDSILDAVRHWTVFFKFCGYSGLVINLDETINLYKIHHPQSRSKNYEKMLQLFNDCMQGRVKGLWVNIGCTYDTVFDTRRGLFSYEALSSRLGLTTFQGEKLVDYTGPVIVLTPLTINELVALILLLLKVFNAAYNSKILIDQSEIQQFLDNQLDRPGAKEFITPRDITKSFLSALSLIRQYPEFDRNKVFSDITTLDSKTEIIEEKSSIEIY